MLFKEDFSLKDPMLGSKMASKLMLDALSSRSTSNPKILLDLRHMYDFGVTRLFKPTSNLLV